MYQPRGLDYWEMLHFAVNQEVVQERDRLFMYWLKTLGIEKGKPFKPTERQKKVLIDGAKVGELMARRWCTVSGLKASSAKITGG
jgi:hypothetical protein